MAFFLRAAIAALALLAWPIGAQAAFDQGNLICETTATTGTTSPVLLSETGCSGGIYVTFASQITSGDTTTYTIVSGDGKLETGTGVYTAGSPDTMTRVPIWSSDGSATALSLTGTSRVYVQWNTASYQGGVNAFDVLSISVDNLNDVTALNATTESTIEAAIDTLANLTSVQGRTVTLADAGATVPFGWDDAAGAYENLTRAELIAFLGDIVLTTETSGNYVATVADGTGIDGTATGEGSTYTPTFDATEVTPTVTWGAGSFTTETFDVGATDIAFEFASGTWTVDIGGTNELTLTASAFTPGVDAGQTLGTTALGWNDLFLDTGATINIENGDWLATHTAGILTVGTGDLRVTNNFTNATSVVTVGGAQTLTSKSLTSPTVTGSPTAAGATWTDLGTVTTIDINGGTVDGAVIGGASAAAITGTTVTTNTGLRADANDGADIGTATTSFSDLYLAEGGTITWDNTDCILTQTGNALATTGCTISLASLDEPTLGTNTAGVYVAQVADGTGIDGTANAEGATYTPTFDATELTDLTWGAGGTASIAWTFNLSGTDPVITANSANISITGTLTPEADNTRDLGSTGATWATAHINSIELANGTANTLTATGGVLSVEGVALVLSSRTLTGGTGIAAIGDLSADRTITLDLTELSTATFGAGAFTTLTFDAGATDPRIETASGTFTIDIGGTDELILNATNLTPGANDGNALGASGTAWADLFLASGGLIEFDGGTTNTFTCTGGNCTIEGNGIYRAGGTDVAVADGGTGASSLTDLITLTTHTSGVYVAQVADGTGVDGSCNAEGCTYTPTLDLTEITPGTGLDTGTNSIDLDLTEISSATWGAGAFTTFTFDAGATDPLLTFGSGTLLIEAVTSLRQADAANAGGQLKWLEDPGTGSNFISILAPASITSDVTCTLENDSNPIPDSCVGDGTDAGGAGAQTPWTSNIDAATFYLTDTTPTIEAQFGLNIEAGAQLKVVDNGATGPVLKFWHDSASSENGDTSADIQFYGGADDEKLGAISFGINDGASGSEDTFLSFSTRAAGTDVDGLLLNGNSTTVSGGPATAFEVSGATFFSSWADEGATPMAVYYYKNNASPGLGETFVSYYFASNNSTPAFVFNYASILAITDGVTPGAEYGRLQFNVLINGADTGMLAVCASCGALVAVNETTMRPGTDNAYDLGNATTGFRDIFLTSDLEFNGSTDTSLTASGAGELTLEGDAVKHAGKQFAFIPAASMKSNVTNGAVCGTTYDSGSNDLTDNTCDFADGATELRVDFSFGMPKAWNEGTVTYKTYWTATTGSGTFQAEVGCVAISDDDTLNTTMGTTVTQSDTLITANDLHVSSESSAITVGGTPAENDYVVCRLSRDTSVDTLNATVKLLGLAFFWTDNASTLAE